MISSCDKFPWVSCMSRGSSDLSLSTSLGLMLLVSSSISSNLMTSIMMTLMSLCRCWLVGVGLCTDSRYLMTWCLYSSGRAWPERGRPRPRLCHEQWSPASGVRHRGWRQGCLDTELDMRRYDLQTLQYCIAAAVTGKELSAATEMQSSSQTWNFMFFDICINAWTLSDCKSSLTLINASVKKWNMDKHQTLHCCISFNCQFWMWNRFGLCFLCCNINIIQRYIYGIGVT